MSTHQTQREAIGAEIDAIDEALRELDFISEAVSSASTAKINFTREAKSGLTLILDQISARLRESEIALTAQARKRGV
ncbi:MAG: hypothetical protein LBU73_07945 [Helicobacteraceae bacterium]|nr:hypothetical protein [Helicobacteraceae bacterium]